VGSLWLDRLAEVWAAPGHAGAGVVVGREGVLTARHVVANALGGDGRRILARVVRPGRSVATWAPMRVDWEDRAWDLALLTVDGESAEADSWEAPTSAEPVVVQLGVSVERHCEAIGFPESAVQKKDTGGPAEVVRQSEQAAGTVAPAGQGKRPVNPRRDLPRRWFPLDVVETTKPESQAGWGGMSGAGVVLPDARLIGIVVTAESKHEQRRLYLVPLAEALSHAPTFAQRLAEIVGEALAVQARAAPLYNSVCQAPSLGPDGVPKRIGEIEDLGAFGVKPADLPREPTYLAYVPRDDDDDLRRALREAIDTGRLLLVAGASAAGKSRSTAEAVRDLLGESRLVRPRADALAAVRELPLAEIGSAVVWLDDIQQYAHDALRDELERLLQVGIVVVGTIRRAVYEQLAKPGDVRNPAGDALTDDRLVRTVNWRLEWKPDERVRLAERVSYPALLEAVAKGVSVGAYCVAGPLLVKRLERARAPTKSTPATTRSCEQ
jgi:Trypsin-like peptidase domain